MEIAPCLSILHSSICLLSHSIFLSLGRENLCLSTMLRLNPTQLRLEAKDFRWHKERLEVRRAERNGFLSTFTSIQGSPQAYRHADIIDPGSLPIGALPMARSINSPPFPAEERSHDWSAVWEHLNQGNGFSPKVQSVKSGNPVLVRPDPEDAEVRSSTASIDSGTGTPEDPGGRSATGQACNPVQRNVQQEQLLPQFSVAKFRSRRPPTVPSLNPSREASSPPMPIDRILRKVSRHISCHANGSSYDDENPMFEDRTGNNSLEFDGSPDDKASPYGRISLAYRVKSPRSTSSLNPQARPFTPKQSPSSTDSDRMGLSSGKKHDPDIYPGQRSLVPPPRSVDYLRRPSGAIVPSPLQISHVAASSSASRRSMCNADPLSSTSSSRLLSLPPKRPRGPREQGSSPFPITLSAEASRVPSEAGLQASHPQGLTRQPETSMAISSSEEVAAITHSQHSEYHVSRTIDESASRSSPYTPYHSPTSPPPSTHLTDPPPLPRYPFHHTPRRVSNTAALPSPIQNRDSSPTPLSSHSYTTPLYHNNHNDNPSPVSHRQQYLTTPSPPPNTPTLPRSTFRIYNDRLPASSQPQTPVGLPRNGIPAEFSRSGFYASRGANFTAPEGNGRVGIGVGGGGGGGIGRQYVVVVREEDMVSPTRGPRRGRRMTRRGGGVEGWGVGEGRENWGR